MQATELRKANWIDQILRRNCHLKHSIEGKILRYAVVKLVEELRYNPEGCRLNSR